MEGVHLMIEPRRRRALQNLSRLLGRAGVNVGLMELVLIMKPGRRSLPAKLLLLALRGAPFALVFDVVTIRHPRKRYLLRRLLNAAHELLIVRRLGFAATLHQAHQILSVTVDSRGARGWPRV